MQSINMNDVDRQYFDNNDKDSLQNTQFDSYNDRPRGWSYICFNETINYYAKHNAEEFLDKEE